MIKKIRIRNIVIAIIVLFAGITLYYFISSLFLHTTYYSIETHIEAPIRVVQLSDLHNAEFGKENSKLISRVAKENPDLIVMTGDMIDYGESDTTVVESLISKLCDIAPVFYGYGNHETKWEKKYNKDLHEIFSAAGATVLECEYADTEINGVPLRIGGYMGYWLQPHMLTNDEEQKQREKAFFSDFKDTDNFRILLNHIPTQWVDWNYIDMDSSGLVFTGHYHGGMVRIPIIDQGLIAPYVGWFPPYTKGIFVGEKSTCILSAGLGIEHHILRFNNPPEIVVADLLPKTK